MKNVFKSAALLSTVIFSTATFACDNSDIDYLQGTRMPIASSKMMYAQARINTLEEENSDVQQLIDDLRQNKPDYLDDQMQFIPGKFNLNNNNNDSCDNPLELLQKYQSFQNKISINNANISLTNDTYHKYASLHRLYELSDVMSKIVGFTKIIDVPDVDQWGMVLNVSKDPISRHCAEAFMKDGFAYVEFDFVKFLKSINEELANLNPNFVPAPAPVMPNPHNAHHHLQTIKYGIDKALGFDSDKTPDMVEQNQAEMNEFQFLVWQRHADLKDKIKTLKSEKKKLLKKNDSLLEDLKTPTFLTLTQDGNNEVVLGLLNMGASCLKLVPVQAEEENGNKKDLKIAEDQLNYSTLKALDKINPKLEKAEKEFGVLSKIVSILEEIYNDVLKHGKIS